jgi:hypothetical protein
MNLKIAYSELERLTGLEVNYSFAGVAIRPHVWRSTTALGKIISLNIAGFVLAFGLTAIPVERIVSKVFIPEDNYIDWHRVVAFNTAVSLSALGGINIFVWQKGRRLKKLFALLERVDRFNEIVSSIELFQEFDCPPAGVNLANIPPQLESTLQSTRANLITAIQIDRLLRQNQLADRSLDRLTATLSQNLIGLHDLSDSTEELPQLWQEAWEIGDRIYRELKNGEG